MKLLGKCHVVQFYAFQYGLILQDIFVITYFYTFDHTPGFYSVFNEYISLD